MTDANSWKPKSSAAQIEGCRTTKIYCRVGCPAGKRMKPGNRVEFSSREEARTRGFRPCKLCKPDADVGPEVFLLDDYDSPLGRYVLVSSHRGLVCVKPEEQAVPRLERLQKTGIKIEDGNGFNRNIAEQLDEYFAGRLRRFDVTLDARGSDFQRQVWELLRTIPYGETRSYGQLARALERPQASRAIGRANGTNPISIIIPCHRVIGSAGTLVGYGGGLDRKSALLNLEACIVAQERKKVR
jgi:methylated-DNA-[protein]-cysteine S-methyltransferase